MATIFDILLNQHLNNIKSNSTTTTTTGNNPFVRKFQGCPFIRNNCNTSECTSNKKSIEFLPPLDVIESNDKLIVEVELAGVEKENIDIEIKESILTIQGVKKISSKSTTTSTVKPTETTSSVKPTETTSSTTTKDVNNNNNNDEKDLPSIEEFEEGDPSINNFKSLEQQLNNSTKQQQQQQQQSPSSNVSATNLDKQESETKKKYILERSSGYFKRYIDLTKILYTLDLSSIKSDYSNGLLTISISKKPDYANTIKISIN